MNNKHCIFVLIVVFRFCLHSVWAQSDKKFIISSKKIKGEEKQLRLLNKEKNDSIKNILFENLILKRAEGGFYNYQLDTTDGFVRLGFEDPLVINQLTFENGIDNLNSICVTNTKRFLGLPFNRTNFEIVKSNCLNTYQNNGYPFVMFKIDSSRVNKQKIDLRFNVLQGPLIVYDSIIVKGNARISKYYFNRITNIFRGKIYSEKDVIAAKNRINELVFVKPINSPDVIFIKDKARLIFYLDKQNANQFDGFAGFLPDNVTGKINITGQAQIKLLNSFGLGENLELNWRKLQPLTQDLRLIGGFPLILGTPFGVENQFKLYKRDTTFIDITNSAQIQYFINYRNVFKVTLNTRRSSLLTPTMYKFATTLPEVADINSTLYGIGIKSENLDYRINPRKGYKLLANIQAGNRKIIKNTALSDQLYNGLQLVTNQYSGTINSDFYFPVFLKSVLNLSVDAGGILGSSIFRNELYRIGGLISLRGFDEESINASAFSITTVEYRYLFEKNSSLFLFFDGAWYENNSVNTYLKDTPFGFGTGISFQTKAGIFTINYALGKQFNNPISLRSAKIHFGLVNFF